jgi:hypothetical protein
MGITLLCLVLMSFTDDPKASASTPAQAVDRFVVAVRNGDETGFRQTLTQEAVKALDKLLAPSREQQRLQQLFDAALESRFGKPASPRKPAAPFLNKDPRFAIKLVKEEVVTPDRVKLLVLFGEQRPSGEIDGRPQQLVAIREAGAWKLELPEFNKFVAMYAIMADVVTKMNRQREEVLRAVTDGKYPTRAQAQKAWDAVAPKPEDILGTLDALTEIPPPGRPPPGPPVVGKEGDIMLPPPKGFTRAKVEIRRAEKLTEEGLTKMTLPGSEEAVYVHGAATLTTADIHHATVGRDITRAPILELTLNGAGAVKAAELVKNHFGKPIAVLVDGKLLVAPKLLSRSTDRLVFAIAQSEAELEKLARAINGQTP